MNGLDLDVEGIQSQTAGKTIEEEKETYPEEWLTMNVVAGAFSYLDSVMESYNGTMEDMAAFLTGIVDLENGQYYPEYAYMADASPLSYREEAIGYYWLLNPNMTRDEVEAAIDQENKVASYDMLAMKYGTMAGTGAMDEVRETYEASRLQIDREVAIDHYMRANPGSTRDSAERMVDSFYNDGNSYRAQLGTYDPVIRELEEQERTKKKAYDLCSALHPSWRREDVEAYVDNWHNTDGTTYEFMFETFNSNCQARNKAIQGYRAAHPDATYDDAVNYVDGLYANGTNYFDQANSYEG